MSSARLSLVVFISLSLLPSVQQFQLRSSPILDTDALDQTGRQAGWQAERAALALFFSFPPRFANTAEPPRNDSTSILLSVVRHQHPSACLPAVNNTVLPCHTEPNHALVPAPLCYSSKSRLIQRYSR